MSNRNNVSTMIVDNSAISAIKSSCKNWTKILCTICQDSILPPENKEVNEFDLIRCPAKSNHIFHTRCFVDWCETQRKCPLCSSYSLESVLEFCEKALSSIPNSKNPSINFYALKMINNEEIQENYPVIVEYIFKTRNYDENVNLFQKIHQFQPTAILNKPNLLTTLR